LGNNQPVINVAAMTNAQKVAALLILLGPQAATEILRNIRDEDEIEHITLEIAALHRVPQEHLEIILEEFHNMFQASGFIAQGGVNYARHLLESTYGEKKADAILDKMMASLQSTPFQFFNEADPTQLATSFQNENPQLVSLVLAYLRPEKAAAVLNNLPTKMQAAVAARISMMDRTNPEVLAEVERILENKFSSVVSQDFSKAGGIECLADILNRSDRMTEKSIMESLEENDPELAENVRELMFVFEDLIQLDDRAIQRMLREVETKDLALALKSTNEEVKEKIFKNMSERAGGMLKDDMEYMGPVRAKDVQEMQTKIVGIIRALEATGEIIISRGGEDDMIV
jgi:flagellar motor switch protein FliG